MNLCKKQKQAHRQIYSYQKGKGGKEYVGSLGLIDTYICMHSVLDFNKVKDHIWFTAGVQYKEAPSLYMYV